jgi:hypothetical protein
MKTLVLSLKNIVYCVTTCNANIRKHITATSGGDNSAALTNEAAFKIQRLWHRIHSEETYVFTKLFTNALACFAIAIPGVNLAEEKEVCMHT